MRASRSRDSSVASYSARTLRRTSSRLFCVPASTRGKPPGVGALLEDAPPFGVDSSPDMQEILRIPFSGGRFEKTTLLLASTYLHTDPCAVAPTAKPMKKHQASACPHRIPAWKPFLRI